MPAARALDNLPIATIAPPHPRRWRATPSRATATPTARSAPAISWPSPPPCSASRAWSTSRSAHQGRAAAALSERRRRGRPRTHLRLRRGDRRAGAEVPIRTLRNISQNPNFGGQAMVVSLGCEKLQPARLFPKGSIPILQARDPGPGLPAGRAPRRLHVDDRFDHASTAEDHLKAGQAPPRNLPGLRPGGRRAVRRQRRLLRRDRQSGGRLRHRPAGARRRHRDVLGSDRGARRHRPADRARRIDAGSGRGHDPRDGSGTTLPARGGVDRSANTTPGNKKGGLSNIVEKAMGSIVKSGTSADLRRAVAGREADSARA
jgi:hypothetical protein